MSTLAIIQARAGSTRLPGKVLLPLCDVPVLEHVIRRVAAAEGIDGVCVATTKTPKDDAVVELAQAAGARYHRGSEHDVLARFVGAARENEADIVVRVTADCPLLSPSLLGDMIRAHSVGGPVDHFSNVVERTFPRGQDIEIVPTTVLETLAASTSDPRAREHVTWGLYASPGTHRLGHYHSPDGEDNSHRRWTLDTPADMEFIEAIYNDLYPTNPYFEMDRIYDLLQRRPELEQLNRDVVHKPV